MSVNPARQDRQQLDSIAEVTGFRRSADELAKKAVPFDFRRPDRIAKSQLRAIHLLHDNFVRNFAASLSAYLRSYAIINLVSVEQLSYAEFLECLPASTCLGSVGLRPYDGNAILEFNPSLIFPIVEMLLGGSGKSNISIQRELTEIEQTLLDDLFRLTLRDLKEAWKGVTAIEFNLESVETDPQLLQILAPTEAVVAIAIEIRIGDNVGMMNIAMPSIVIKMMRQKFDQQWSVRKSESTVVEQSRILNLIRSSRLVLDTRLEGPTLKLEDLIHLEEGDVLCLDYALDRALHCSVNGKLKFQGKIVSTGQKLAFVIEERAPQSSTTS